MVRLLGKVKWFNNSTGFGFLSQEDGPDVFVHYRSIQTEGYQSLQSGESVSFEIVRGSRGPQAERVQPLDRDLEQGSEQHQEHVQEQTA